MKQEPFFIHTVAVLGAGVMGAQIAAHCANAGLQTFLFDMEDALVHQALDRLSKMNPHPLATPHTRLNIQARNYKDHLSDVSSCDLVIEAIAECLDWKAALYERIGPYLQPRSILATNTSGLSVRALAEHVPAAMRTRFCGMHFFNPPRYMHLVELIPAPTTSQKLLSQLERWLTHVLGKGVVCAHDTPNFIANRIGVFSLLSTMQHAQIFGLGVDEVDALTGLVIGHPKSATFRTMDVVGLDTLSHVVQTMHEQLSDDPWHAYFTLPAWLKKLITQGALGQKTGAGIYRKRGSTIEVYDLELNDYRPSHAVIDPEVQAILRETDPQQRMQRLCASHHKQAQFLAAYWQDLFHYSAYHVEKIADSVQDIDLAMRWGFGWALGPFETWQACGMAALTLRMDVIKAPLPAWMHTIQAFYQGDEAYSPTISAFIPSKILPVRFHRTSHSILFENKGLKLWMLEDDIAVMSFKSKANTIGQDVLEGMQEALDVANAQCQGIIMYQDDAKNFGSGADLRAIAQLQQKQDWDILEQMVKDCQHVSLRLKYNPVPVVAAVRGRALGGVCEWMLHCAAVVASFESYPGLVEVGIGLIPAGGGSKEMAWRAAQDSDHLLKIKSYFEQIAMGTVASSAPDARQRGYLKASDRWVMHENDVLPAALSYLKMLIHTYTRPPVPARFSVVGREGHAQLQAWLVNFLEGQFISQYDYDVANQLAYVMCGGDVDAGTLVEEAWMLALERQTFMTLAAHPLTQARIQSFLETGKPLRN